MTTFRGLPSAWRHRLVLGAAFLGWMCAGVEMGLGPLVARPALRSLLHPGIAELSPAQEATIGGWFAGYLCAFLLGAAAGGVIFGRLADRSGRVRAMGTSILCYSIFTGLGWLARSPGDLLALRFIASLGIGGMWPAGVALVSEAWPDTARPTVAGIIGMAANVGILVMALLGRQAGITPESWRWVLLVGATPAVLGMLVLAVVPESPAWLAERARPGGAVQAPVREILRGGLLPRTLVGIGLATVPLVGAWGSSKWLLPWADQAGGDQALAQAVWAGGAVLGGSLGGWVADRLGRRTAYFLMCVVTLGITVGIYRGLEPTAAGFLPAIFALGLVGTLFFGWLPLYLPELFPTRVRATGSGTAFNMGRVVAALGVLASGWLMTLFDGDYARVGEVCAWVYVAGMLLVLVAPDTRPGGGEPAAVGVADRPATA